MCGWTWGRPAVSPARPHQVVDGALGQLRPALGDEQPGKPILPRRQVALDGAQLVAGDGMLNRQAILGAAHPHPRLLQVQIVSSEAHRFADPQAVAVHHQHEQVVANAVPALLRGVEEEIDLAFAQEVFVALVGVGCMRVGTLAVLTLPISPLGHGSGSLQKTPVSRQIANGTFPEMREVSRVERRAVGTAHCWPIGWCVMRSR